MKKANKSSYVVVLDINDCITETETQLGCNDIYKYVNFSDKSLQDLEDRNYRTFRIHKSQAKMTKNELQYFTYKYRNATNFLRLYLLALRRLVIVNCGTPREKISEFPGFHHKPLIQVTHQV